MTNMTSAAKLFNSLFSVLAPRQREVVSGRFGLGNSGEPETLAAIGEKMGVTRERVRQIENSALGLLGKQIAKDPVCVQILSRGKKYLQAGGGVMKKESLLDHCAGFVGGFGENHLALLLEASGAFSFYPEDENYQSFYYANKDALKAATSFIDGWADLLNDKKEAVLAGSYKQNLADFIKARRTNKVCADNFLSITKKIHVSVYGDVGLKEWPEINPLATRDRIYLVLKKMGKPLHFTEIADGINKAKLASQTALSATVHNELIKDPRFVLVGRGTYGLKEQGYEPGVAREVIARVLKAHGPLRAQDVVEHVKKQRFYEPNTVLINLQNRDYFERMADGRYRVKEA